MGVPPSNEPAKNLSSARPLCVTPSGSSTIGKSVPTCHVRKGAEQDDDDDDDDGDDDDDDDDDREVAADREGAFVLEDDEVT